MRRPRRSLLSQVPADPHLTSLNFVPSAIIHIYGKLEDPIPQGLDCTSLYMSTITTLNPLCKCFETLVFQFKTHQKSDQLLPIFNKPNISQGMMLNWIELMSPLVFKQSVWGRLVPSVIVPYKIDRRPASIISTKLLSDRLKEFRGQLDVTLIDGRG